MLIANGRPQPKLIEARKNGETYTLRFGSDADPEFWMSLCLTVHDLEDAIRELQGGRPDYVTDEHLDYLDALHESGVTNMFGAGAYVAETFGVSAKEANKILQYWMESFGKENR